MDGGELCKMYSFQLSLIFSLKYVIQLKLKVNKIIQFKRGSFRMIEVGDQTNE